MPLYEQAASVSDRFSQSKCVDLDRLTFVSTQVDDFDSMSKEVLRESYDVAIANDDLGQVIPAFNFQHGIKVEKEFVDLLCEFLFHIDDDFRKAFFCR